jgi:hypothetical protein
MFIQQKLNRPQGLKAQNHRIYADHVEADGQGGILLSGVAFIETQGDSWTRYGTAQGIRLRFEPQENRIRVAGMMTNLTLFDRKEDQFSQIGEQEIAAPDVPFMLQSEIKFLTLGELLHFMGTPQTWPPVVEALDRLRASLGRVFLQQALLREWDANKKLILGGDPVWSITGGSANRLADGEGVEIAAARIEKTQGGVRSEYQATRAVLEPVRSRSGASAEIRIEAYGVSASEGERTFQRDRTTLGPVPVSAAMLADMSKSTIEEMIHSPQVDEMVQKRQRDAHNWLEGTYRRIVATLHERTAFTLSVLVLVVLGASLGIVFRGASPAAAFGISFIPTLLVIILIVTGKQLAQNAGTFAIGLALMWSGIVAVGMLDWYSLTRWMRR